ncbi:asparagine synthase (glutamine-hydrolyzing) [Leptobacterium flavescens]|uniref:asparagine synthase (glutamine-hydrolyzing) n=1 Tax=Leptobacterium flavescens TaxID=472055 RepID=A0A6P0UG11_9FLAO|nr:asparagine synthase (glutamine-hydrolyzing) [Leptobacterium flavescens]NER12175.1 asparagine synthase (glutamine-hydrolyzing) [Leptobacterium flavescens]
MCGIAGILSAKPKEHALKLMLESQRHRGPDFTGTYIDEGFASLGHNRLSIIDLSAAANQPFIDESGRYILVFNGEIYNYVELKKDHLKGYAFKTTSDTEVLLALFKKYGKECLDYLNGMFSFAIWDSEDKKLFAARDRFGVKPFYYSLYESDLYFASEIKSIQKVSSQYKPDEKLWANYFCYGSYGMPDETFFKGISQLPGGHFLEYKEGVLNIEKWYDFEERVKKIDVPDTFEEAKNTYFELLRDSISLRFRADVKLGFNISGGVDSSTLLMLVNLFEDKKKISAYTFYTGDENYDELTWVEQMIGYTQNPLNKIKLDVGKVPDLAERIGEFQDEPYGGLPTIAYAKIFEQARKDGIIVLLDGQGMDEQWAGYDYYLSKGENTIQGQKGKSPFKSHCISEALLHKTEKPLYPKPFDSPLLNMQYRDLFYTKIPRALRFNDRVSMAFSTELREPFLDYRLVEFAFAQPQEFKIYNGTQKYMLRTILSAYVNKNVVYAPKRPLQTPQREWLGNELRSYVDNAINTLKKLDYNHWFDFAQIEREWRSYLSGDNSSSFHIWQWMNTALILNSINKKKYAV